jgi:hypothetical protein
MWTVIVSPTGEGRFAIWLFDPKGPHIRGPDGGKDYLGYVETDARSRLVEFYKLSEDAADFLIQGAKANNTTTDG